MILFFFKLEMPQSWDLYVLYGFVYIALSFQLVPLGFRDVHNGVL